MVRSSLIQPEIDLWSEILCLAWLPASLTKIRSKMNELAWRHHFPIISQWDFLNAQGHLIPKGMLRPDRNSDSSEILCLSLLPANLMKIETKLKVLAWRHRFPQSFRHSVASNSEPIWPEIELLTRSRFYSCPGYMYQQVLTKIRSKKNVLAGRHHFPIKSLWEIFRRSSAPSSEGSSPIWPKFELIQEFIPVLVTCNFDEDRIKTEGVSLETSFSTTFFPSRASNSEIDLVLTFMPVLVTNNFDEDPIKNERVNLKIPFFHYKSMGNFLDTQGHLTP